MEKKMVEIKTQSILYPAEVYRDRGIFTEIPVHLLWPRQPSEHYRKPSERAITKRLHLEGMQFLRENPIHVVLLSYPYYSQAVIDDGHHRARFAPRVGIYNIPALVADIGTIARTLGRDEQVDRERFSTEIESALASLYNSTTRPARFADERPTAQLILTSIISARDLVVWLHKQQAA